MAEHAPHRPVAEEQTCPFVHDADVQAATHTPAAEHAFPAPHCVPPDVQARHWFPVQTLPSAQSALEEHPVMQALFLQMRPLPHCASVLQPAAHAPDLHMFP